MAWTVVEGVYKDGQVSLEEDLGNGKIMNVLVLIPVWTQPTPDKNSGWKKICQKIMADNPEFMEKSVTERRKTFDRLSEKIANNLPYESVEEFERAMRGEHYGLVRY